MYYLVELLDSPCIILTQVLVKMLRYNCMYKYKIVYDDWFDDLSNIFNRIDNEIKNTTQLDDLCLAGNCSDSGFVQFVDRNQICNMIDMLCTR